MRGVKRVVAAAATSGVLGAAVLGVGVPTASANPWNDCGDSWHQQWCDGPDHQFSDMVWRNGPDGRPGVWVESWKWNWTWTWRCDNWGNWDWYLDPPCDRCW